MFQPFEAVQDDLATVKETPMEKSFARAWCGALERPSIAHVLHSHDYMCWASRDVVRRMFTVLLCKVLLCALRHRAFAPATCTAIPHAHFQHQSFINTSLTALQPACRYHQECEAAMNEQINIEYTISYVYHSLYSYFDRDNVGLPGFAAFFRAASDEERGHAELLMSYQTKRGGRVKLQVRTPCTPLCRALVHAARWRCGHRVVVLHPAACLRAHGGDTQCPDTCKLAAACTRTSWHKLKGMLRGYRRSRSR